VLDIITLSLAGVANDGALGGDDDERVRVADLLRTVYEGLQAKGWSTHRLPWRSSITWCAS
jgi:hypothetical protein